MNFFYRSVEAAQAQAKSLTASASQSAKELAEQFSEHTRSLAEQAASVSSAAAEQAGQRWKGLNIQDALQLKALQQKNSPGAGPPREQLEQYAITPEFVEFIRSLTYSTFRDFPLEQLPELPQTEGAKALTPWQEKHALLVVQEVKEINELRFVLCPKRMSDTQFWQVYFTLARKYLPGEAYERPAAGGSEPSAGPQQPIDLPTSLRRTLEAAREAARDWHSRASGSLRPHETSAQLHDLVESRSRGGTPRAPAEPAADAFSPPPEAGERGAGEPADLEHELEAYLQTIAPEAGGAGEAAGGGGGGGEEAAVDLDEYLNELQVGEEGEQAAAEAEAGSEDAVDLEQYMQELQEEERRAA